MAEAQDNGVHSEDIPHEGASSDERFIGEYHTLKESLGLVKPVISYPACGGDISLSFVFPDSETYYIDTNEQEIQRVRNACLPEETTHLITQSAFEYTIPQPVDLVVLRNASTDKHDTVGLTKGLREGGYVVESHWGSLGGAQELLQNPNFSLVGVMEAVDGTDDKFVLDRDTNKIAQQLREDTDIVSNYAGKGYVFQKVTPQQA